MESEILHDGSPGLTPIAVVTPIDGGICCGLSQLYHIRQTTLIPVTLAWAYVTIRNSGTDLSALDVGGDRKDEFFAVLSHPSRRFVLSALQDHQAPVSIETLAMELADWHDQRPVSEPAGADGDDLKLSLVHTHLPKIADAGLVDYDASRQVVTAIEPPEEMQAYLRTVTATGGGD